MLTFGIWGSFASPMGAPPPVFLMCVVLYFSLTIPSAIHLWRKPAEARRVLLNCQVRRAEFRIDEGVVDEGYRSKAREASVSCTDELFRVEPVNVGLGMYAVVINLDGYPFAVAASRSADTMLAYVETLNEALHESMTR